MVEQEMQTSSTDPSQFISFNDLSAINPNVRSNEEIFETNANSTQIHQLRRIRHHKVTFHKMNQKKLRFGIKMNIDMLISNR